MNIGIVTQSYHPRPGGVTENVHHTATGLAARGHRVTVITSGPPGDSVPEAGFDVIRLGRNVLVPANGAHSNVTVGRGLGRDLRALFSSRAFDLLHTHNPVAPTLPLLTLSHAPPQVPIVGTFHVSADRSSALHLFRGPLARRAERLDLRLAVSHTSREFVARYLPGPFQIVPNGVDPERFSPEVPPLPELCDGCFNVLFVGRLEPRKGIRNLFRAAALLAGRLPAPLRVVLVGEEGRTRFPSDPAYRLDRRGYVPPSELPRYYASCQVFCAPAVRRESFGIILLEAMASGVPVVATSIPGYRELISPDAEGLLVEPRDPGALAGALEALARDTERRRRLGESGRRKALRFSWERVVDRLEELYAGLVGGEREPVPLARAAQAGRP